jgi:protoporphyrinogen oxidase
VPEGYPIYHLGYDEDRRQVLRHVHGVRGLASCGRQGAFRYIFMDTAMQMGLEAARALLAGRSTERASELGAAPGVHEAKALTA